MLIWEKYIFLARNYCNNIFISLEDDTYILVVGILFLGLSCFYGATEIGTNVQMAGKQKTQESIFGFNGFHVFYPSNNFSFVKLFLVSNSIWFLILYNPKQWLPCILSHQWICEHFVWYLIKNDLILYQWLPWVYLSNFSWYSIQYF